VLKSYSLKHECGEELLTLWVDSAIKTAYSILNSWRKNYLKGDRERRRPTARRLFARAKQTLVKLEGEKLRLTVKPGEYVYLDLSKRYFPLPGRCPRRVWVNP